MMIDKARNNLKQSKSNQKNKKSSKQPQVQQSEHPEIRSYTLPMEPSTSLLFNKQEILNLENCFKTKEKKSRKQSQKFQKKQGKEQRILFSMKQNNFDKQKIKYQSEMAAKNLLSESFLSSNKIKETSVYRQSRWIRNLLGFSIKKQGVRNSLSPRKTLLKKQQGKECPQIKQECKKEAKIKKHKDQIKKQKTQKERSGKRCQQQNSSKNRMNREQERKDYTRNKPEEKVKDKKIDQTNRNSQKQKIPATFDDKIQKKQKKMRIKEKSNNKKVEKIPKQTNNEPQLNQIEPQRRNVSNVRTSKISKAKEVNSPKNFIENLENSMKKVFVRQNKDKKVIQQHFDLSKDLSRSFSQIIVKKIQQKYSKERDKSVIVAREPKDIPITQQIVPKSIQFQFLQWIGVTNSKFCYKFKKLSSHRYLFTVTIRKGYAMKSTGINPKIKSLKIRPGVKGNKKQKADIYNIGIEVYDEVEENYLISQGQHFNLRNKCDAYVSLTFQVLLA